MTRIKDMSKEEKLIRVSEGKQISGYKIVEFGLDAAGKYKMIETPEGSVEKVYCMGLKDLEKAMEDSYNRIHNYRREGDSIVLHYNIDTGDIIVLAVKAGDNLANYPFNLKEEFVITEDMLNNSSVKERKGIVPINKETLVDLKKMNILSDETEYVLFYNKKNVGFYL